MKIIGITGGVGAGKSRVLSILREEYQAEIIQADEVAKELEEPGQEGYCRLRKLFGEKILAEDGTIDKKRFASMIFCDHTALRQVNEAIHPLVWNEMKRRAKQAQAPLLAMEAALFDESSRLLCEQLWFVDASEENRIERLRKNRGYSREKCLDIMARQNDRTFFLQLADVVIDNNGSIEAVRQQIADILKLSAKDEKKERGYEIR